MSILALNWAGLQMTGSPAKKVILMILADLADEDHSCWPSVEYIYSRAEISKRSFHRYMEELVATGFIRSERRDYGYGMRATNRYFLAVNGLFEQQSSLGANLALSDETPDHKQGAKMALSDNESVNSSASDPSLGANCGTYIGPHIEIKDKSFIRVEPEQALPADSFKIEDEKLSTIHPSLTVARISNLLKVADPETIDFYRAAKVLFSRTNNIFAPASFVAKSIDRTPFAWIKPIDGPAAITASEHIQARKIREECLIAEAQIVADCTKGVHDWGPESWGELNRSYCVRCNTARHSVDTIYAELEAELDGMGGA